MKVTFYYILPPINASCGTSILQCNYKNGHKQLKVRKAVKEAVLVLLGGQFSMASFFSISGEDVSGVDLQ